MVEVSDHDILLSLASNDVQRREDAFCEVMNRYKPNVVRFIRSRLIYGARAETADLTMQTFEALWGMVERGTIGTNSKLDALLITIAKHQISSYFEYSNAQKRTPPAADSDDTEMVAAALSRCGQPTSTDIALIADLIQKLVAQLPENQQKVARAMMSRYPELIGPTEVQEQCEKMGFALDYRQVVNARSGLLKRIQRELNALEDHDEPKR